MENETADNGNRCVLRSELVLQVRCTTEFKKETECIVGEAT